jgi:hypothetical protein
MHGICSDEKRGPNVTDRRDYKRRVRERQARTGESYTAASRHVANQRTGNPMAVVELVDITDVAAGLGFACQVCANQSVLSRVPAEVALRRLHRLLVAVDGDAETAVMRALAFRGESPTALGSDEQRGLSRLRPFLARARAGAGGAVGGGRIIVLHDAMPIMYVAWPLAPMPAIPTPHAPRIVITTLDMFEIGDVGA